MVSLITDRQSAVGISFRKEKSLISRYITHDVCQDPGSEEDEDGEARVGFIQLNSGSTSFNTTLNLTGPILLGLGIAAATLFYAYFNAFNG